MTEETKNKNQSHEDEVDLIALVKTIWEGRKTIIVSVIICAVIGVVVALFTPKVYTASTTMVPQVSDGASKMGGLSSLAAIAGFNLDMGQGGAELSPMIYPQIVESVPFQLEVMNTRFNFPNVGHPVTVYEYYTSVYKPGFAGLVKEYTIGLPGILIKNLKKSSREKAGQSSSSEMISLSEEQNEVREIISEALTLDINDKEGYLTLSVNIMDAQLAAEMAKKGQELLQEYITTFKLKKASAQLKFIEERYQEKKSEFETAQSTLASFRDRNRNVTSAVALTEETRLQNEYQLAFEVYSELAKQLEQAQIKVKEDTPVFSIIRPVIVPFEKTKPKRAMIFVIWTFLGGIVGVGWIFAKQFLATVSEKWNEN